MDKNQYAPGPVHTRKLTPEEIAAHEAKKKYNKKAAADLSAYVVSVKCKIKKRRR
jgi:hypothetical protein